VADGAKSGVANGGQSEPTVRLAARLDFRSGKASDDRERASSSGSATRVGDKRHDADVVRLFCRTRSERRKNKEGEISYGSVEGSVVW
jgi:hypothetical protein